MDCYRNKEGTAVKLSPTLIAICLLALACSSTSDRATIDSFVQAAESHGWTFMPSTGETTDDNRRVYDVTPGEMTVTLEWHAGPGSAEAAAQENNLDIDAIKRHVIREGVPLGEMGSNPQAFVRHNLTLYVPLDYIVYYPEASDLVSEFMSYQP